MLPHMTAFDAIRFDLVLRGCAPCRDEIETSMGDMGCLAYKDTLLSDCSLGMRKRIALAGAFAAPTPVVLLDEPINGLDAEGVIRLKKNMRAAADQGSIVVVSAHVLAFMQQVCDRVLLLKEGKIVRDVPVGDVDIEVEFLKLL